MSVPIARVLTDGTLKRGDRLRSRTKSLQIDEGTHAQLKAFCQRNGTNLKTITEVAILSFIRNHAPPIDAVVIEED